MMLRDNQMEQTQASINCFYDSSPKLFMYHVYFSLLWSYANELCAGAPCPDGGTLKVALLSALHASMHHWLFLFYLDTAASSLTYSLGLIQGKKKRKKKGHLYKKDYVLWKTLWHKNTACVYKPLQSKPKKDTLTNTYCTLWWQQHSFPLGRELIHMVGYHLSECSYKWEAQTCLWSVV